MQRGIEILITLLLAMTGAFGCVCGNDTGSGGSNPEACTALDQCHDPGIRDPGSGLCSDPAKADGTACNDASAGTTGETCEGGTCTGCLPLDEFIPFTNSPTWHTVTLADCSDLASCDWNTALQAAINSAGANHATHPVVYIPAGTYDIHDTLVVRGGMPSDFGYGLEIIGADPATTTLRWTGAPGGDMLILDYLFGVKVSRLTLDGQSQARIASHQVEVRCGAGGNPGCNWPNGQGPFVYEYSDIHFTGFQYGIVLGDYTYPDGASQPIELATYQAHPELRDSGSDNGDSVIRRCRFTAISEQAIVLSSLNALNWQVWDSWFIGVHHSLQCNAGAFGIYNSYFENNDSPDIVALSVQWMDLRGNVAVGGNQFVFGGASYSNVIGNSVTISSPPAPAQCRPGSDCSAAMWLTAKELLLLDNTFNTPAGIPAVAEDAQGHDGRRFVTSGGNTYNGPSTSFLVEPSFPGNPDLAILDLGDNAYGTTKTVTPVLPATPPASGRIIYTIVPDDPAYPDLAAQINDKANHPGAVVYFPAGTYMLNDTIAIQGGIDVIIAGDGPNTLIIWNGIQPDKWAFDVLAPARASFRDLRLIANANSTQPLPGGIRVRTNDGPGGMVYGEQVYLDALTIVEMAGVDNTAARFEQLEARGEVGVRVTGGGAAALDRSKTRGLIAYGGGGPVFAGVASIANYGKVVLEGQDFEGGSQAATFDQPGYFTTAGGRYHTVNIDTLNSKAHTSYPSAPNFSGTASGGAFAFLNAPSMAGVYFSQSSANVLALGLEYDVAGLAPQDVTPGAPPSGQLLPPVDTSFPVNAHLYDQVACGDIALASESVAQGKQMSLANEIMEYCGDSSQCAAPIPFDCQNATAQPPDEAAFVASMLADLRAGSVAPRSVCGETDVRIHRIFSPGVFGAPVPGSDSHAYSNRALTTAIRIGP